MPRDATEHIQSAEEAGLQYRTDSQPGIRRKGAGKGFFYLDDRGRRITDANLIARIKNLAIPPAWTDVWICPIPTGHIQATGRDAKNRKQYRYHKRYREIRDETKFERILEFSKVFPAVRKRVERHLSLPGLPRRKILATVVRLLEATLIRVGNDEYARDNKSYGLTTLRDRHAEVEGWKIRFNFRGKSRVDRTVSITDGRVAKIVQRCQDIPGRELFQYLDENGKRQPVGSGDVNEYIAEITGSNFTAKDFRTWAGTVLAAASLRDLGVAQTEKETKANILTAIDAVADRLGNTRAICRHYYIHPKILDCYRDGRVIDSTPPIEKHRRESGAAAALRRDEVAVLALLELQ